MQSSPPILLCSECFQDVGLRLNAQLIGYENNTACPNCGSVNGHKLTHEAVMTLSHLFFVWGTLFRSKYGAAPIIQFNDRRTTDIRVPSWLEGDLRLIEQKIGVGFFYYGPRLWMIGEVEPLKALQKQKSRTVIIERILREYPSITLKNGKTFYRIRKYPKVPYDSEEFDSPPSAFLGRERFDSKDFPVMYCSPDLQVCIHECRVTAEDELYVATLSPKVPLKFLDLSVLIEEQKNITEFESLDMAVHMLFLAGKHSYKIARDIAKSAYSAGYDGLIYPSYFSLLRIGEMPLDTTFGISHRRIHQYRGYEQSKAIPNYAIFGYPIREEKVRVSCINRLVLHRVEYRVHFGPVGFQ